MATQTQHDSTTLSSAHDIPRINDEEYYEESTSGSEDSSDDGEQSVYGETVNAKEGSGRRIVSDLVECVKNAFLSFDAKTQSSREDPRMQAQIERYLLDLYPNSHTISHGLIGITIDTLLQERVNWPPESLLLIKQLQHDYNLYSTSKKNKRDLGLLVQKFKRLLGLTLNDFEEQELLKRCKSKLSTFATKLKTDGYITREPGSNLRTRTPLFEKLWGTHMDRWKAYHTTPGGGLTKTFSRERQSEPQGRTASVRAVKVLRPQQPVRSIEANIQTPRQGYRGEPSKKRQRSNEEGQSSRPKAPCENFVENEPEDIQLHAELRQVQHGSELPTHDSDMYRAPPALMVGRQPHGIDPEQDFSNRIPISPVPESHFNQDIESEVECPELDPMVDLIPSGTSSVPPPIHATMDASGGQPSMLIIRNLPNVAGTAISSERSDTAQQAPALHPVGDLGHVPGDVPRPFIFADVDIGADRSMLSEEVFELSLYEFAALVCQRARRSLADVGAFWFLPSWQRNIWLGTIKMTAEESEWQAFKQNVDTHFHMTKAFRERMGRKTTDYQLWVWCLDKSELP